jgi:hypothetical protein
MRDTNWWLGHLVQQRGTLTCSLVQYVCEYALRPIFRTPRYRFLEIWMVFSCRCVLACRMLHASLGSHVVRNVHSCAVSASAALCLYITVLLRDTGTIWDEHWREAFTPFGWFYPNCCTQEPLWEGQLRRLGELKKTEGKTCNWTNDRSFTELSIENIISTTEIK